MASLNRPSVAAATTSRLVTHEGAPARRIGFEAQLRRSVMACMLWEDEFYEDGQTIASRIHSLAAALPPETVAAIAIEARERMHLRHVPLWLTLGLVPRGGRIVGDTLARVIQRPDELSEVVAMYWKDGRRPLSAQLKRGLALAFPKFDAYALAKYNRDGAVKLRDVLFLTHPKPKDEEQAETWKALVDGTLPAPDTWEVALSAGADKRETWERLIQARAIGGLAMLRNLRNMQQAEVNPAIIRDGILTANMSRVLPFRFISAARFAPLFEPELEEAMFRSLAEMPKLSGKTVMLVDHSASMSAPVSAKSDITRLDAAIGLTMLLREVCESVELASFSDSVVPLPPRRGFGLGDAIRHNQHASTTMMEKAKAWADERGYDRLIIISDEQTAQALSNPKGRGYMINVASNQNGVGYGSWLHIDGWSEAIVDYIQTYESAQE